MTDNYYIILQEISTYLSVYHNIKQVHYNKIPL